MLLRPHTHAHTRTLSSFPYCYHLRVCTGRWKQHSSPVVANSVVTPNIPGRSTVLDAVPPVGPSLWRWSTNQSHTLLFSALPPLAGGNPAPRFKLLAARRAFSRLRPTIHVASRSGKSRRFGRSARRPGLGVFVNPGMSKGSVLRSAVRLTRVRASSRFTHASAKTLTSATIDYT